ncbi:unnamed protein product [Caenorhabditis nigoni]
MPQIWNSNKLIEDETYYISRKNVLGKSKNWDNFNYLIIVVFSFLFSTAIESIFSVIDFFFRKVKRTNDVDSIAYILIFFEYYNLILLFSTAIIIYHISQRFLKLWAILAVLNILIAFAALFYLYKVFTTDPNSEHYFDAFKYMLLSMPIWLSIHIFANGFGAVVLWKISNLKRGYYGEDTYLVIYGGEESSTKKMAIP